MAMMPGVPRMTRHDASTDGALRRSKKEQTDDGLGALTRTEQSPAHKRIEC